MKKAELGDYDPRKHPKFYVSEFRFLPDQSPELEGRVEQIHKTLAGQVPSVVEMTFLEKIKWLDMYGVDLHSVTGDDHMEYVLGLTPSGVVVMKNKHKTSTYFWPRITKVLFKGRCFMIRVRNKTNDEVTSSFMLPTKEACEYLWKCCVEHHAFFRLTQVKEMSGNPMQVFRLGSKYRYSGRTEQQIRSEVLNVRRSPPPIVRVPSRRFQKRLGQPDGADAEFGEKENFKQQADFRIKDDLVLPSFIPSGPLYRSLSTPAVLAELDQQQDSTSLAPWEDPMQRGLFFSRQSLTSHCSTGKFSRRSHRRRSSSVESNDLKRRRSHRSKRYSDNESDTSRCSRSSRNCDSFTKARSDNGSDTDSHHRSRRRKYSRRSSGNYNLVDSEDQWRLVQQQQKEKESAKFQNAIVRDLSQRRSGYTNSGIDTESETIHHLRKKHLRHSRSRSRSPEVIPVLSREVKKHIKYSLIDPKTLTEEERKAIKYTKIESENAFRIRYSPSSGRPKCKVTKISSRDSSGPSKQSNYEDDPPPPYSSNAANGKLLLVHKSQHCSARRNTTSVCRSNVLKLENSNLSRFKKISGQAASDLKEILPPDNNEKKVKHENRANSAKKLKERNTVL